VTIDARASRVALYAAGGVSALATTTAAALVGLMYAETRLARRRIPKAVEPPPVSHDTTWAADGVSRSRRPIHLAVLGDSLAAGYGVSRDHETSAAQLAMGISAAASRPVHVTNMAVVGANSHDLPLQVSALGAAQPELAVVMIGANDVVDRTPPAVAVPYLEDTVRALRELGAEVIVCTCPDLGTIRPLAQPLRAYARRLSRTLAKQQTVAVVRAGGRTVSLGDLLGPLFTSRLELFSADRFHPSAEGYGEAASAVLPSCLDALGLRTRARSASAFTTRRAKPVAKAAAQAASRPGTEVAGVERPGRSENRRAPLARLRRRLPRRRRAVAADETSPDRPAAPHLPHDSVIRPVS
jgi:lysophospholipase L1-like esterase